MNTRVWDEASFHLSGIIPGIQKYNEIERNIVGVVPKVFDIRNKHYIIKLSSGKTINIYHRENIGLYYRVLDKRNRWLEPILILRTLSPDFSVCSDTEGNVSMLVRDRFEDIIHLVYKGDGWETKTILKNRGTNVEIKSLKILSAENRLFYFYVVKQPNKSVLSFQVQKSGEKLSEPNAIDYIADGKNPFRIVIAKDKSIYAFYRTDDGKYRQIGYKRFNPAKDVWGNFFSIAASNEECEILSASAGQDDSLHLCWEKVSSQYELMYAGMDGLSGSWSEERRLGNSDVSYVNSSMIWDRERIVIYWIRDKEIFYRISIDNGVTWTYAKTYEFSDSKAFYCINYISDSRDEGYEESQAVMLPGDYKDGYRLAFMNDNNIKTIGRDTGDLKEVMVETLRIISEGMDDVKESVYRVNRKVDILQNRFEELESRYRQDKVKQESQEDLKDIREEKKNDNPIDNVGIKASYEAEVSEKRELVSNSPVMPGAGFKNITFEYLKNLQKGKKE